MIRLVTLSLILFLAIVATIIGSSTAPDSGYMVRADCLVGHPWLVWPGFLSDLALFLSYSVVFPLIVQRITLNEYWEQGLPVTDIILAQAFVQACGLSHLAEAINTWTAVPLALVVTKQVAASLVILWALSVKVRVWRAVWIAHRDARADYRAMTHGQ